MSFVSSLGNNIGFVYVMEPDGTSFVDSLQNTQASARIVKSLAVAAPSLAQNKAAIGTITVTAVTGIGDITAITIDGNNQINSNISYTGATTPSALATSIATGINNFAPAAGYDYTAVAIGATVYIIAPTAAGSSVNGLGITVTNTGNLTVTTVALADGSSATSVFDEASGYRFYLNATAAAAEGNIAGADEITNYLIPRGQQASIDTQSLTIASGAISPTRKSSLTNIIVDTEGAAAADDLTDIVPTGFVDWDILVIRGANAARVTTVKSTGNISLKSANDFSTDDDTATLTLQYKNGSFYETSRSSQQIGSVADYRTAGFPFTSQEGVASNTITDAGGAVSLTANTSKKLQSFSGTASLIADYTITLNNAGAIAGDEFYLGFSAVVTLNAFNINIVGGAATKTFTATQALNASFTIYCYFDGAGWQTTLIYNFFQTGAIKPKVEALFIADNTITPTQLTTEAKTEIIVMPVSFETGEQAQNKIKMNYAGTVSEIYAISTKAIAATDDGTVTPKNNAGVTMTNGVVTFTASDPIDTAYTTTPTANNTFVAGDVLTFLTNKATAGGKILLAIKILRS